MFYEQSSEYITWARFKHACRRAFVWGMLLGLLGVGALAVYWFVIRSPGPKEFEQTTLAIPGLPASPMKIVTYLEGLDYCKKLVYGDGLAPVERYANVVVIVPVLMILGCGVLAVIVLTLSILGSLRFRPPGAQARAADTMN